MIRDLRPDEVEFDAECLPEQAPIRGNCSAIDEETDRKTENWIRRQLRQGNDWAWCTVRVVARWKGYEGEDFLGCCSYRSQEEFCQPGHYFDDMKSVALDDLNTQLQSHADKLEELWV